MTFILITLSILVVSFIAAVLSLKKELSKPKEVAHAERELKKEKILFKI